MTPPDEYAAFVTREHARLTKAVTLLLDDRAVAEEIAQEALLRAASRWETVRHLDSPGAWTHRVAVNLATSHLRRRQLARRALHRTEPDTVHDLDTAAALDLRDALQRLAPADRRLLVLRYVLDWTTADVAAHEGVTDITARKRLQRARDALRDLLTTPDDTKETADVL